MTENMEALGTSHVVEVKDRAPHTCMLLEHYMHVYVAIVLIRDCIYMLLGYRICGLSKPPHIDNTP